MDWITRDALAARHIEDTAQERKPAARKALGLPNREAVALPAADGKRVLVRQPWTGSKRKASPCISYHVDDPSNVTLFTPTRERTNRHRATTAPQAYVPEVAKFGLHNNIGQDYSG